MKRTIIITDPCYIGSLYVKEDDDEDNSICGINFLVNRYNLFGDWYCLCYRGDVDYRRLSEEWEDISCELEGEEYEKKKAEWIKNYCYGEFCADSGNVCVAYLDDVLEENPKFEEWMKTHQWCVTVIPDFDGTVEEVNVDGDFLRLIGRDSSGKVIFWTDIE